MVTKALFFFFLSWILYSLGPCPLSERKTCPPPTLWEKNSSLPACSSFFYWGHLNWSQADLERKRLGFSPGELTSIMIKELGNALGRGDASPHCREELSFNTLPQCKQHMLEQDSPRANQRIEAATSCPFTLLHPFLVN